MKKFMIPFVILITFFSLNAQQNDFWDRVEVSVLGGPLFTGGDEADIYNFSTGYYIGLDARYQLFRFMAVGISVGRNAWSGNAEFFGFDKSGSLNQFENSTDISSGKTNACVSFHFGPSAPTWTNIASLDEDISDVKPYSPGMIVPFFIFDIGPYFWDWTEENEFGKFEESGSDVFIRGTLAGFYQVSRLLSITLGFSYTLYEFGTSFTSTGILAGLRFNMGQIVN
ncbi:MAG: hypothetical protein HKM87_06760 [Ignavibacteriaceae bacterium]|nr:hypothetical protein [Ignavibacteriaceae bacterium]